MATVVVASSVFSERYAEQVTIAAGTTNLSGATRFQFTQPAGFGDALVLEALVRGYNLDSYPTATILGVQGLVHSQGANAVVDLLGVGQLFPTHAATNDFEVAASIDPDQPVIWKEGEILEFVIPDLEAAGQADLAVYVRCRRLRTPVESRRG